MPTPTTRAPNLPSSSSHPAPPIAGGAPCGGVPDGGALPGGVPRVSTDGGVTHAGVDAGVDTQFERQTRSSTHVNTMQQMPVADADWVIEPEVPRPEGTFLEWPTRRAFFQDNVEMRFQIRNFVLSSAAEVQFEIRDLDPVADD